MEHYTGAMSVLVEFTIAAGEFRLGEVLDGTGGVQFELERIVPMGQEMMPFVWVRGGDHAVFETRLRNHDLVEELLVLDKVGDSGLYRITWTNSPTDLAHGITAAEGSVLEARGNDVWAFRLRFPSHDHLVEFHEYVLSADIPLQVKRSYPLAQSPDAGNHFGLTECQREALLIALERGYFSTPRETSLGDVATELGITRQAMSDRLRRANEKVLREVLQSPLREAGGEQ